MKNEIGEANLRAPRLVNGQWSMVNVQWSMVNGQRSMVNGQWSMFNKKPSLRFSRTRGTAFLRYNSYETGPAHPRGAVVWWPSFTQYIFILRLRNSICVLLSEEFRSGGFCFLWEPSLLMFRLLRILGFQDFSCHWHAARGAPTNPFLLRQHCLEVVDDDNGGTVFVRILINLFA